MRLLLVFMSIIISACTVAPVDINYGKAACHFCKMTIIDNQHAAELVTSKGKVFQYDAIECMINDLKPRDKADISLFLINDYSKPGMLVDAKSATFLISEKIKSPMGAYLSGFESKKSAQKTQNEQGGNLFSWEEIQIEIK